MYRILLFITPILLLTACGQPEIVVSTKYKALIPPNNMYNCPTMSRLKNVDKLTDQDIANYLVTLFKNNRICYNSIMAIKDFETKAVKIIGD
jgi:hypothetical protein